MKIFSIATVSLILTVNCFSQNPQTKPVTKPIAKPVAATKPALKDIRDSASYAMGIYFMNAFKQQGIENINSAMVAKAINDIQAKKTLLLNDNAANISFHGYRTKLQALKSKPTIDSGNKFLSVNRQKPTVKTTASGLQYEIISEGTGVKPVIGDTVICNYRGTYINGVEFDASYRTGKPATFALTQVISGWTEALQLMPVGSKWKLYIPYQLGYGPSDYNGIPGGSVLIFDLELIGIKGK
jgi:FKBP-type peptidyl-prolyl cis-trans isomerase FklB